MRVKDISKFEKMNANVSINVFGLKSDSETICGPFYLTKSEKPIHCNLLLLQTDAKNHYVWIKSFSALVRCQMTKTNRKIETCISCLAIFLSAEKLKNH